MPAQPVIPRLTLSQLWLALAILLPGLSALLAQLSTVDLAYQLRAGGEILDGTGIPRADTWTFTIPGQPWLDQQWLAQVILAATWRVSGWIGLILLRSVLVSAAWALLVVAIRSSNPALAAREVAGLAIAALVVSAPALALRPQLLGIFCFCLVLALLAVRRSRPRLALGVPLVVAIWANVHGSFLLGPVLAGIAWLEDVREPREDRRQTSSSGAASPVRQADPNRTLAIAVTSAAATLVTPFGPGALVYAITLSANRELAARITEWQPPSPFDPSGMLFFASLAVVATILIARRRLVHWPSLVSLGLFAALAIVAARGVAWWPSAAAVALAPLLPAMPGSPRRDRPRMPNTVIVGLLVVAALALVPFSRPPDAGLGVGAPQGVLRDAPSGISATLLRVAQPGDRIWNPQPWGSWLELAFPTALVAVDSRIELFPSRLWADYDVVAVGAPGWQQVVQRYGATILVAAATEPGLIAAARRDPGWRELAPPPAEGTVFIRSGREPPGE